MSIVEHHYVYILFKHDAPCCCLAVVSMALLPHQAHATTNPTMAFETLKASKVFRRVAEPRVENMLFVVEDFYCA